MQVMSGQGKVRQSRMGLLLHGGARQVLDGLAVKARMGMVGRAADRQGLSGQSCPGESRRGESSHGG